tara:strand:- start:439 stop:711 length:273 start_codon:yes stop_codon:yes gene_type:complete
MSRNKNFKILRTVNNHDLTVGDFNVGDVFEREGSLHMRVNPTGLLHAKQTFTDFTQVVICNLNTGAAWVIPASTLVFECLNVKIEYQVNK